MTFCIIDGFQSWCGQIKKTMSADDTTKLKNKLNTALAAQVVNAYSSV